MKIQNLLKSFMLATVVATAAVPAYSVTDSEMDQARAIAAKAYLRYINNGSGYLDEVSASSMDALKKKLKAKELENLKAFTAIKAPADYASWDKAKLIEYWVKVLDNPSLQSEGKAAKGRIRKQIGAMTVSAPAPETPAEAAPAPEAAQLSDPTASAAPQAADSLAAEVNAGEQDILADQKAMEQDTQTQSLEPEQNNTWIYVLVLCLLIGVVIWLVAYAARLMKKQSSDVARDSGADAEALRESARQAIDSHKETIERLTQRLNEEQARNAEISRQNERLKLDNKRLTDQMALMRSERTGIDMEMANLKKQLADCNETVVKAAATPAPRRQTVEAEPKPEPKPEILNVIYLGRANSRGIFVRADRRVSPGNTVFRLDTQDGIVGTFSVVNRPDVMRLALGNPQQYLAGGCNCDLDEAAGASEIITDDSGTAIFENGYWKVLRKATVSFR